MTNSIFSKLFLTGASVLVLSACLPEDSAEMVERDSKNLESQVQLYSQAFQQYSNRSISAVINTPAWQAQLIPEGVIDLSTPAFGSLDMGNAEAYVESAYCKSGGEAVHLTWFDAMNSSGKLELKGLGAGQVGIVNQRIKTLVPDNSFGVSTGSSIKMSDGSLLTLSGTCASLNIPKGTAVAAISLPTLTQVTETQNKTLMRGISCPADQEGGITQSVNVNIASDGKVFIGANVYASEAEAVSNYGGAWTLVSNNCVSTIAGIDRSITNSTTDAINVANLVGLNDGISKALKTELTDIECKQSTKIDAETGEKENKKEFETCGTTEDLDLLDDASVRENKLLRVEEEQIITQCPNINGLNSGTVIIKPSNPDFAGLPISLNDKVGNIVAGAMTGQLSIKKISRFWEVVADYGDGPQTSQTKTVEMEGVDIQCRGNNTLTVSCPQMYPQIHSQVYNGSRNIEGRAHTFQMITNNGMNFSRSFLVSGWENKAKLKPNDGTYQTDWTNISKNVSCLWREQRRTQMTCGVYIEGRQFTATDAANGSWNNWHMVQRPGQSVQRPNPAYQAWVNTLRSLRDAVDAAKQASPVDQAKIDAEETKLAAHESSTAPSDTITVCLPPPNSGNSGNTGGSNCFVAGTLIAMADGTTRRVETLHVGDETLFGRIMHKYVRSYEEFASLTSNGIIDLNGGIIEYDGVITTGNHPLYLDGKWTRMGSYKNAMKVDGNDIPVVYNFLTEHHVVPVVGKSGQIYFAADDLNNINNSAELGRIKMMGFDKKIA